MNRVVVRKPAKYDYPPIDPALVKERLDEVNAKVGLGVFSPLGPDRESGVFLLFLLGDDIEGVSFKTGIPKDILVATADKYQWESKKNQILNDETSDPAKGLQKNITNMLLVATYVAVKKEMEQVMSGSLDPEKSRYIPSSLTGIKILVQLMNDISGLVPGLPGAGSGGTNVTAQNVQIVQQVNGAPENAEAKVMSAQERSDFLKALVDVKK